MRKVVIWGNTLNKCQELDFKEELEKFGIETDIWNPHNFSKKQEELENNSILTFPRNKIYHHRGEVEEMLEEIKNNSSFLCSSEGILLSRDKLKMSEVMDELDMPYLKTFLLGSSQEKNLEKIEENLKRFSDGIILKDRYGGGGKGVCKIEKRNGKYITKGTLPSGRDVGVDKNKDLGLEEIVKDFSEGCEDTILQGYLESSFETENPGESETTRVVYLEGDEYFGMNRRAKFPVNNWSLVKKSKVKGEKVKTDSCYFEKEISKEISKELDLFISGSDFIRTDRDTLNPELVKNYGELESRNGNYSILLEMNGLVQLGGINSLYSGEVIQKATKKLREKVQR